MLPYQPVYLEEPDFVLELREAFRSERWDAGGQQHISRAVSATRLFHSDQSTVFRVKDGEGSSVIVKLCNNVDAARRERQIHDWFRTYPVPVPTPQLLTAGDDAQLAWLVFEDNGLQAPVWARHRALSGVRMLALLHDRITLPPDVIAQGQFASHTPGFDDVIKVLTGLPTDRLSAWRTRIGLSGRQWLQLTRFLHQAVEMGHQRSPGQTVLCHGDIHWGNMMWSGLERRLYFIDWSFVHENEPYFDLLQMLDATSPTSALQKPIRRLEALYHYYSKRTDKTRKPFVGWARGYVVYATVYLLWILSRIDDDRAHARFSQAGLDRQTRETLERLVTLHRDFRRLSTA